MADSGDLSDTLRKMAENPPSDKVDLGDVDLEPDGTMEPLPPGAAEQMDLELDDESGEMIGAVMHDAGVGGESGGAYDVATTPAPVSYTASSTRTAKKREDHSLKAMMVPVFFTVGALLLVPAIWSVLLLLGFDVPLRKSESSTPMALVMLACWPISGVLLFGASFFYRQIRGQAAAAPQE
jgi:hypothetical protein